MSSAPATSTAATPAHGRAPGVVRRLRSTLLWLAPFLVALGGYLVADREMRPPFTGDEPHYALEAFSYALDGDRDLTNDYASIGRVLRVTGSVTLQPQARRFFPGGPLVSFHGAGLPLLLAPAAKLGGTVGALQLEMIAIAAIGAQLLFSIMAKLVPRPRWMLWAVWASIVFSLPLVGYSARLYPEMPAAVVVLAVARVLMASRLSWVGVLGASALIGALPWLHVRFAIVAAGLALAVVLRVLQTRDGERAGRLWAPAVALAVPLIVSAGLLSVTNHATYGSWSLVAQLRSTQAIPNAPVPAPSASGGSGGATGGAATVPAPPSSSLGSAVSPGLVFGGVTRGLLSSRNGWLPFAPVALLGVAGILALAVRRRRWIAYGGLVALVYLAEIASTGVLPGFSLPARFEVVAMPLVAVPLLLVVRDVRWSRALFWPLAALGAVITVFGVTHATGLVHLTPGKARADIGAADPLLKPWPIVSREPSEPPAQYPVGVCAGSGPRGRCDGHAVVAGAGRAGTVLAAGRRLEPGEYTMIITLARDGAAPPGVAAARVELLAAGQPFEGQTILAADVPTAQTRSFTQDLRVRETERVQTRVVTTGAVGLRVTALTYNVATDPSTGLGAVGTRYPDLGRVLAWLAAIGVLAAALALSMRRRLHRTA